MSSVEWKDQEDWEEAESSEDIEIDGDLFKLAEIEVPQDGLKAWYKPETLEEDSWSEGDTVDYWEDSSGAGNHLDDSGDTDSGPEYREDYLNGHPVLEFNNTNQLSRSSLEDGIESQPNTWFTVHETTGTSRQFVHDGYYGASDRNALILQDNDDEISMWSGGSYIRHDTTVPYGWIITTGLFDDPDSELWVDGDRKVTGSTQNDGQDGMLIGEREKESDYFDGRLVELLFYNKKLSQEDQETVEDYLADKYGLTLDR